MQPLPGGSCLLMEVRMWMRVTLMRMMKRKKGRGHYGECWSNGVQDWVAGEETGAPGIKI